MNYLACNVGFRDFNFPSFNSIQPCSQVDRDCDFLEQERIMDYSLLVGIHFREMSNTGEPVYNSGARTPVGK